MGGSLACELPPRITGEGGQEGKGPDTLMGPFVFTPSNVEMKQGLALAWTNDCLWQLYWKRSLFQSLSANNKNEKQ